MTTLQVNGRYDDPFGGEGSEAHHAVPAAGRRLRRHGRAHWPAQRRRALPVVPQRQRGSHLQRGGRQPRADRRGRVPHPLSAPAGATHHSGRPVALTACAALATRVAALWPWCDRSATQARDERAGTARPSGQGTLRAATARVVAAGKEATNAATAQALRRPRRTMWSVAGALALLALLSGIAGGALANATPAATPSAASRRR